MARIAFFLLAAAAVAAEGTPAQAGIADETRVVRGVEHAMMRRYPASPWKRVGADGRVPALADIRCDETCSVAVDRDNTVVLSPSAIIASSDYFYVPIDPEQKRLVPAHRILLAEGLIEVVSPNEHGLPLAVTVGANEHVAVRTGRVQIAHKEGHTAVGVLEGQGWAGSAHRWISIPAKQSTIIVPNVFPRGTQPMVEAPKWISSGASCSVAPLAMSDQGQDAKVGTCWDSAAKSASYRVELARDPGFQKLVEPAESTDDRSWSKALAVGRYFIRVRAVDADGLSSEPSAPRKMAVVPLVLPPGSFADSAHGTVVLPEGRDVSFGDAAGLDVAIDNGGFLKAPSSMRMDGAPSHQLRIRLSDDPSSVSTVHVLRRALRADVRISPKTARWPNDPIDIAVTIEDPTGLAATDKVEPQLHVLLGLTELPLSWTHHGAVWSVRVQPRRMGGPTVLRVIANDEHGITLGRNFLEIDGA